VHNSPDIKSNILVQVDWQNTFIYHFKCSKCHCSALTHCLRLRKGLYIVTQGCLLPTAFLYLMPLQKSPDFKINVVVQVDWQNTFICYFKCSKCHWTCTDTLSTFSERTVHCHTRLPITVGFLYRMPLQNSSDIKSNIVVQVDWQNTFI